MVKERHHEAQVEYFEDPGDSKLRRNLLQKRLGEPLDRDLGVGLEKVCKVSQIELADGRIEWAFNKREYECAVEGQGSLLLQVDQLLENFEKERDGQEANRLCAFANRPFKDED